MRTVSTLLALAVVSACGGAGTPAPVEGNVVVSAAEPTASDPLESEVRLFPLATHLLENDQTRDAALAMQERSAAIIEAIRTAAEGRNSPQSETFDDAFWAAMENEARDFTIEHMFVDADYPGAVVMRAMLRWDSAAGSTFNELIAKVGEDGQLMYRLGDMEQARHVARAVRVLQTHSDARVRYRPHVAGEPATLLSTRVPGGVQACVLRDAADESKCYLIPNGAHSVSNGDDELCFHASDPSDITPCQGSAWSMAPRPLPSPSAEVLALHGMEGEVRDDLLSARYGYSGAPYVVCLRQAEAWACGDGGHIWNDYSVELSDTRVRLPWIVSLRRDVQEDGSEGGGSSVALILHRVREDRLELRNRVLLGESDWSRDGAEGAYGSDDYEAPNVRFVANGCLEIGEGRIHRRRSIPPNIDERHPDGLDVDEWIPSEAPHGLFAISASGDLQPVDACEREAR